MTIKKKGAPVASYRELQVIEDIDNRSRLCQRMDEALGVITDPLEKRAETVCTEI